MARLVTHLSVIRERPGYTLTGTLCNRMHGGGDINCTDVATEVTCKFCQRLMAAAEKRRAA